MSDGRINNGGHPTNGGRKPKADEQLLIEKLTPLEPLAFAALKTGLEEKHNWAVKLWFEYTYGKPRETKDLNIVSERPIFNGIDLDVPKDNSTG